MNQISFSAILPQIQSAIKVSGGEGNCTRLQLDCYGLDVEEIKTLRGKEFKIIIEE